MRKGYGDPDLPTRYGEGFLAYLHRLAQDSGYIPANVRPPSDRKVPKRHGQRGAMERIDAIFGIRVERQPGEDAEPVMGEDKGERMSEKPMTDEELDAIEAGTHIYLGLPPERNEETRRLVAEVRRLRALIGRVAGRGYVAALGQRIVNCHFCGAAYDTAPTYPPTVRPDFAHETGCPWPEIDAEAKP